MNEFMLKFIRLKNIIFISVMLFILSAALSGCGKGDGAGDGRPEYVYVPEYVEMDMECDYISSLASSGDDVFLSVSKWDEETGFTTNYLYRYNMNENKATRLSGIAGEQRCFRYGAGGRRQPYHDCKQQYF